MSARDEAQIEIAFGMVRAEFEEAVRRFHPFNSAHEGWAVIREEDDELWDAVKNDKRDPLVRRTHMRHEAMQTAAMAIRFMVEITPRGATDALEHEPPLGARCR